MQFIEEVEKKKVAIIVAHPDDETLWCGGTILSHTDWQCFVLSLCRKSDSDRAPKFFKVLKLLGAEGAMGDLNDGPEQFPLATGTVEKEILQLLPGILFDIVITHDPRGEYTRHRRHEETSRTVMSLWKQGKILTKELWTFAYEDGDKQYYPQAIKTGTYFNVLSNEVWTMKYDLITREYGFTKESWEAETTPKSESFHRFASPSDAVNWFIKRTNDEIIGTV